MHFFLIDLIAKFSLLKKDQLFKIENAQLFLVVFSSLQLDYPFQNKRYKMINVMVSLRNMLSYLPMRTGLMYLIFFS